MQTNSKKRIQFYDKTITELYSHYIHETLALLTETTVWPV